MKKFLNSKKNVNILLGGLLLVVFAQGVFIAKLFSERDDKTYEVNLVKINTEKDILKVLESYALEGQITSDEKAEIHEKLIEIITTYSEFFDEKWEVINEKDIMISERGISKIYRPDRILKSNEGCIIVDFKTGQESEKNDRQIERYKIVLESLGMKVLKTQLIYL